MSEQVHRELAAYTSAPALFSPHPMFENFGTHVDRDEACRELGIDPSDRYALFFGLIRDYKGSRHAARSMESVPAPRGTNL